MTRTFQRPRSRGARQAPTSTAALAAGLAARNHAVAVEQTAAGKPGGPEAMRALQAAEAGLTAGLGKLFALAEAYPDLKANQNMAALQEELTSTENRVAFARQAY